MDPSITPVSVGVNVTVKRPLRESEKVGEKVWGETDGTNVRETVEDGVGVIDAGE